MAHTPNLNQNGWARVYKSIKYACGLSHCWPFNRSPP